MHTYMTQSAARPGRMGQQSRGTPFRNSSSNDWGFTRTGSRMWSMSRLFSPCQSGCLSTSLIRSTSRLWQGHAFLRKLSWPHQLPLQPASSCHFSSRSLKPFPELMLSIHMEPHCGSLIIPKCWVTLTPGRGCNHHREPWSLAYLAARG